MKKNKVVKIALSSSLVLAGLANVVAPVENIGYAAKNKDGVCENTNNFINGIL